MAGALRLVVGLIGVFWLAIVGAWGMWAWDRRPAGWPDLPVHVLFFRPHLHLPASLGAQLGAMEVREARSERRTEIVAGRQLEITSTAEARAVAATIRVRTVTHTIVKEVPLYVTPAVDHRYPLSVGFVRLHDASALGLDMSAVPGPAGEPDDAPSAVAESDAARVIASNYGSARECAAQLIALQDWITAERTAQ